MLILALCIFCNVLLAVIFKGFARYQIDNLNAIIINYLVCVVVASLFLGHSSIPFDLFQKDWLPHSVVLAAIFIFGFNIMALAFQHCGVALTVIWQKMSLIIPVAFAIALYGEPLNWIKGLGITLAMTAIVLVNLPESQSETQAVRISIKFYLYLFFTWFLSGIIEILLFYVQAESLVTDDTIQFTATSFGLAAVFGLIYSMVIFARSGKFIGKKELLGGLILGIPNFLTIYLLLALLSRGWEGSVLFPMNNIGILIFTAIIGFVFFRERLNTAKTSGLILAVLAILMIGLST